MIDQIAMAALSFATRVTEFGARPRWIIGFVDIQIRTLCP